MQCVSELTRSSMKAWGNILDPSGSSGVSVLPCLVLHYHQLPQVFVPALPTLATSLRTYKAVCIASKVYWTIFNPERDLGDRHPYYRYDILIAVVHKNRHELLRHLVLPLPTAHDLTYATFRSDS